LPGFRKKIERWDGTKQIFFRHASGHSGHRSGETRKKLNEIHCHHGRNYDDGNDSHDDDDHDYDGDDNDDDDCTVFR